MKRLALVAVCVVAAACATTSSEPPPRGERFAAALAQLPAIGAEDVLLVGAGDIAECDGELAGARATAALVQAIVAAHPETIVFTAGDNAYGSGTERQFAECYDTTWGAFRARTYPTIGNHDYKTDRAAPYFRYFGANAGTPGEGWYSVERGAWQIVALNSMAEMRAGSPQVTWLERELSRAAKQCTVAIWHHPRFSSGRHGYEPFDPGRRTGVLWDVLRRHRAEAIVNGHEHFYERFEVEGMPQFVVGTGGVNLRRFVKVRANSVARDNQHHGVLALILRPSSYEWRFLGTDGGVHDSGSGECR